MQNRIELNVFDIFFVVLCCEKHYRKRRWNNISIRKWLLRVSFILSITNISTTNSRWDLNGSNYIFLRKELCEELSISRRTQFPGTARIIFVPNNERDAHANALCNLTSAMEANLFNKSLHISKCCFSLLSPNANRTSTNIAPFPFHFTLLQKKATRKLLQKTHTQTQRRVRLQVVKWKLRSIDSRENSKEKSLKGAQHTRVHTTSSTSSIPAGRRTSELASNSK